MFYLLVQVIIICQMPLILFSCLWWIKWHDFIIIIIQMQVWYYACMLISFFTLSTCHTVNVSTYYLWSIFIIHFWWVYFIFWNWRHQVIKMRFLNFLHSIGFCFSLFFLTFRSCFKIRNFFRFGIYFAFDDNWTINFCFSPVKWAHLILKSRLASTLILRTNNMVNIVVLRSRIERILKWSLASLRKFCRS